MFFKIKDIIEIIQVYKISIKKLFLINIIIYFIVPNLVSKEEPSRVQKIRPNITFIILVVINTEENKRQIWTLNIVYKGMFDNINDILLKKRFNILRIKVDKDINFITDKYYSLLNKLVLAIP